MDRLTQPRGEHRVRGEAFDLPLVEQVSTFHSLHAARITWHAHHRFELIFVRDGATSYEFRDGRTVEVAGARFVVLPPRHTHRALHDVRTPASLCGVIFDPRAAGARRHTPFTARDLAWLARHYEAHTLEAHPMGADLRRQVDALDRLAQNWPAHHDAAAAAELRLLACAIIFEAARQLTGARPVQGKRAVDAALTHLQAHFHEPLPMADLARATGCSRARLFQLFKENTGLTPNDYLQRLRVNKARDLLVHSTRSITDVAFATGFSSSQYFSKVFRKYDGTTPTVARERQAKSRTPQR
jgi:AraC-like DNA-binding protein/mannose-6-phosphate isomerase-like protein (cupin superfamily)